jgi:hypothetical protein
LANIFILNNAYYVSANVNNSELSSHVEAKFSRYLQDVLTAERNTYKERCYPPDGPTWRSKANTRNFSAGKRLWKT